MKKAWLVQRGKINRPLNSYRNKKLSDAVDFDYMGSSEFEFGALPKSNRQLYVLEQTVGLKEEKVILSRPFNVNYDTEPGTQFLTIWVLHALSDEDFQQYIEQSLSPIFNGKLQLQEVAGFEYNASTYKKKNDFFWDIENHVMWSPDKRFMKRLMSHLEKSWLALGSKIIKKDENENIQIRTETTT